jgi:hypothetical protein
VSLRWIALVSSAIIAGAAPSWAQSTAPPPASGTRGQAEPATEEMELPGNALLHRYGALRRRGLRFEVGSIRSGSGIGIGAEVSRGRLVGTPVGISLRGAWSIYGSQEYDFRVGMIRGREYRSDLRPIDSDVASFFSVGPHLAFGTSAYLHVRDRRYQRIDFYGLGQESSTDGRSSYALEGTSVDLVVQHQMNRHVGFAGRTGVVGLELGRSSRSHVPSTTETYGAADAPWIDVQPAYRAHGASVTLDFRHPERMASQGAFINAAVWRATPRHRLLRAPSFTRVIVEAREFVGWRRATHVLAVHGLLSTRLGDTAVPTPFYLQPALGGSRTMRGLDSYRLRGESLWTTSVEYRWQAHKWFQVVPFVDAGAVAERLGGLRDITPAVTPGLGIRGTVAGQAVGRLEVAHGRDGYRGIVSLNAPF